MDEHLSLEFLVIGAQKAGTTTLWKLMRDHPEVWLPDAKEAPFFSHTEVFAQGLESYLRRLDAPRGEGVLRGTVTPHYMQGWHDASTSTVAERIARTLPRVRLIALLREPIARARSQHAMALARGRELRDADRALSESLRPQALRLGRSSPDEANTYVVQGEYGRVLQEYLRFFGRAALHVELSETLSRDPRGVMRRVLRFIGAREDYEPPSPLERSFAGGREPRVADGDVTRLLQAIDAARKEGEDIEGGGPVGVETKRAGSETERAAIHAWAVERELDATGRAELEELADRYLAATPERSYRERVALEFTLRKIWNVVPSPPEPISDEVRTALVAHFRADGPALRAATGLEAAWEGEWAATD